VGPDHILLVQGSRISETYQRVYYRDVQALLVMKRNRFLIDAWLWLLPVALLFAVGATPFAWRSTASLLAVLIVLGVIGYLVVAGAFYSCRLYLATAVGNVPVASVFRVWQARKFNRQIRPLILAVQHAAPDIPAPPRTISPPVSTE
jgi:hypothetical protein